MRSAGGPVLASSCIACELTDMTLLSGARHLTRRMLGVQAPIPAEEAAYRRLADKGYKPCGIVDVGAYHGEWTRLAHRVFGSVPTLMVEAQPERLPYLERAAADLSGVRHVAALLSERDGETAAFYEMETGSSLMAERSNAGRRTVELTTRTLDSVAADVPGPLFLKIDVQGAELKVLGGGAATLARAEVVQLEISVLPYNEGAPTMLEVLAYMDARGFAPYDLSGITRPTGGDLAQIDLLFTLNTSSLRPDQFEF